MLRAVSGYAGGDEPNPTYKMICSGMTKYIEVVQVDYDTSKISTNSVLKGFFLMHNPTQLDRQGNDVGYQYKSVIFYKDEE